MKTENYIIAEQQLELLIETMKDLSFDERTDIIDVLDDHFCRYCGCNEKEPDFIGRCQCMNDD